MSYKRLFENELVYNSQYITHFIYSDDTVEKMTTELIEVKIDEKGKDKKMKVELVETFKTNHNFGDIEMIVIDIITSKEEVKVRKIFEVGFNQYNQKYGGTNNTLLDELSMMYLTFEIKDVQILQEPSNTSFESLIREIKINKILK